MLKALSKLKITVLSLSLLFGYTHTFEVQAQSEKELKTTIKEVTVFLNKAQLLRSGVAQVPKGNTTLIIKGLSPYLDANTVQVTGKGAAVLLGVESGQNYLEEHEMPKDVLSLRSTLRMSQEKLRIQEGELNTLSEELLLLKNNQSIGGEGSSLTVAELRSMADFYRTRLREINRLKIETLNAIEEMKKSMAATERQLQENNAAINRNTTEIRVKVSAMYATTIDLKVKYVVGNAGWVPVYDARTTDTQSPITLQYKAEVYQNTGLDWNRVKLTLSTANPTESGQVPTLYPNYISLLSLSPSVSSAKFKKTIRAASSSAYNDDELSEVVEEQKESVASLAGRTSINTTGLNTTFNIQIPYTVRHADRPTVVDVQSLKLATYYSYSGVPKLEKDVFLTANITDWQEYGLLPGKLNVFYEGTYMGESQIDPQSIGDTLQLSLGRDKKIIVKRTKKEDFTNKKLIGTNRKEAYAYEISVKNMKKENITIDLKDQIPVSRNGAIAVELMDRDGAAFEKSSGFLEWKLDIAPSETKVLMFRYEVKYPKNRRIGSSY